MPIRNRLWLKSLLLVIPLVAFAVMTLFLAVGQILEMRADVGLLEREVSRTIHAEVAGRSFYIEIKEYADSLLGDEDVREEITEVRQEGRAAFEKWQQSLQGDGSTAALAEEYQKMQTAVDGALELWDQDEIRAAQHKFRQEVLECTAPLVLWRSDDVLENQARELHSAVERLRFASRSILGSTLGMQHQLEESAPHLRSMVLSLRFSRLLYAELLEYGRLLLSSENGERQQIDRARWRANLALEQWRTNLDDQMESRRQQLEQLARDVQQMRSSADRWLQRALAGSEAEAMEALEEQVETLTRDVLIPGVDALVLEEQRAVTREMQELTRLTQRLRLTAYGLSAVVLLLSLAALSFLRRSILRPVNEIRTAIERFRKGESDVRVAVRSRDELGLLSAELNRTTEELTRSREALESRTRDAEAARQRAEVASRVKSEFLFNMSHEIRTPINGVVGCVELLSIPDHESEERAYYDLLSQSLDALLAVVEDIFDASQLMTGQVRIEPIGFELRKTVSELVERLRPKAEEKNLALTLHFEDDLPPFLMGDPKRIRQILVHVIGNALKFTERGNVAVEVGSVTRNTEKATRLRIDVRDTGIGIPEEEQATIFEPFTQADSSITRRHGGTGLGLSISRQLAELMGGSLSVTSSAGKGSAFSLLLPLSRSSQAPQTS